MAHIVDDIKKGVKGVKGMGDVLRGEALEATDRAFESRNSRAGQEADIISESKHRATADKGRRDIEGMDEMFARREWARKHADNAHPVPSGEPAGLHGTGGVPSHGTAQPTSLSGQPAGYEHSTSTTTHAPLHGHHPTDTAHGSAGFPTQSTGGYPGENLQAARHETQNLQNTSYPDHTAHNAQTSHQEPIGSHLGHGRSAAPGISAPADAVHPTEGTYQGSRNLGGYP